jgi:hypothetical protein
MSEAKQSDSTDLLGPDVEDGECGAPPRVTDAPADLWLVYGELEHDDTHWNCCRDGEVSWCEDKQYDSDVHYVRGDRYDDLRTEIERLTACLKKANEQADHFEREWYLRGDALEVAVRQNEHDMLMTGEELRACRAALGTNTN